MPFIDYRFTRKEEKVYSTINKHLLIGVSEIGDFLLLPYPEQNFAIKMFLCGTTQFGKSITMTSIADRMYHNWGAKMFFVNDDLNKMYFHQYPARTKLFIHQLNFLKQTPEGLPLVFCYPSLETLKTADRQPGIKVSIPFEDFIISPELFYPIKKTDAGIKYFHEFRDELLSQNSFESMVDFIKHKQDLQKSLKMKFTAMLHHINIKKMFDMENPDSISSITMEMETKLEKDHYGRIEQNPLVALMAKGLIPIFMTKHLKKDPFLKSCFEYYIGKIFEAKIDDTHIPGFSDSAIYCFADEMNALMEKNKSENIINWVTQGANLNLGLFWAAQNFAHSKIDHRLKNETPNGLIFNQSGGKDVHELGESFGLSSAQERRTLSLKKMEFMAVTKDYFLLLNPETGRISKIREPIVCKSILPMSDHRADLDGIEPNPFVCDKPTNLFIKGKDFMVPYDMSRYKNIHNLPKFYQGVDLLKKFWSEDVKFPFKPISLTELESKDYILLYVVSRSDYGYYISETNQGFPEGSRKVDEMPNDLIIQLNLRTKMIRLFGKNALFFLGDGKVSQPGFGEWLPFLKKRGPKE